MTRHEPWQLDGTAAELYQLYLVPAITSLWAVDLIRRAAPRAGERVLDVACGTGVVARQASERMKAGQVVGLDINAGMLAVARSLPPGDGPVVEWREGSALAMPFPDGAFDLVLCQLGLQFFPDRPAALREMARVLAPGSRLALSVYNAIENTPVAKALAESLDRHLGQGASSTKRSEHLFVDPDDLRRLVVDAGFGKLSLETVTQTIRFSSPREYVRLQIAATPMAAMVDGMEKGQRDAVIDAITGSLRDTLGGRDAGEELVSPQQAYVVLAQRNDRPQPP